MTVEPFVGTLLSLWGALSKIMPLDCIFQAKKVNSRSTYFLSKSPIKSVIIPICDLICSFVVNEFKRHHKNKKHFQNSVMQWERTILSSTYQD